MERYIARLIKLLRYRFLLLAGLLPYGLGTAIAYYCEEKISIFLFLVGLLALFFVLIGVEAYNEFFDWLLGTDKVFQKNQNPVSNRTFVIGSTAFFVAFIIAIYLTLNLGIMILILAFIGFFAAFFYLAPPLKLAYRGFGEIVIALSYGPFMVLGSYYIQTQRVDIYPLFVSIIPALLLFAIAVLNEVPDYFQDKLVGKRNICVLLGRKNAVLLCGIIIFLFYAVLLVEVLIGKIATFALISFICLPISLICYTKGMQNYDNPQRFVFTIRYMLIQYVVILSILITGYIVLSR